MQKINYWSLKKEALFELCNTYGIEYDETELDWRKKVIPQIIEKAAVIGKLTGAYEMDAEGNEVPIETAKDTFNIIFYQQEDQPKYVFLGHDGHSLYCPREQKMCLPLKFKGVVEDAVQIKVVPKKLPDGRTKGVTEMRVPRFSYQILPD